MSDPSPKPPGLSPPGWIARALARIDGWDLRADARHHPLRDPRSRVFEWLALAYALGLAAPLALATSYTPALWAGVTVYHAVFALAGWPLWRRLGRPSRERAPARLRRRAIEVLEALEQLAPQVEGAVRLDADGAFELRWSCEGGQVCWSASAQRGAPSALVVRGGAGATMDRLSARLRERVPPELARVCAVVSEGGECAWRLELAPSLSDAPGSWGALAACVVAALDRAADPLEAPGVERAWSVEGRRGAPWLGPGALVWPAMALGLGLACASQAGAVTSDAWGAWAITALACLAVAWPALREVRKLRALLAGRVAARTQQPRLRQLSLDAGGVQLDGQRIVWARPFVERTTHARGLDGSARRAVPWVNLELFQDGTRVDVSARLSPTLLREHPAQLQRSGAVVAPGAWLELRHHAALMMRLHGHTHYASARGSSPVATASGRSAQQAQRHEHAQSLRA